MASQTLGARCVVFDSEGGNLGTAHLPRPVEHDDVFALETGRPPRVAAVVELEPGGMVAYALEAEPARLPIIG